MSEARFRESTFLAFRKHVLRSCENLLARAIAVSPWLGGQGRALPCFCLLFSLFLYVGLVFGLPDVGLSDVGLTGCRIALEMGFRSAWGALDQAGHKSSTQAKPHSPRARAKANIYGAS